MFVIKCPENGKFEPHDADSGWLGISETVGHIGHDRKWSFFVKEEDQTQEFIEEIFTEAIEDSHVEEVEKDGIYQVIHAREELGVSLIYQNQAIISAYPYVDRGFPWTIETRQLLLYPNHLEGQLVGSCHGSKLGLFDINFCRNKSLYLASRSMDFIVNAFAYKLFHAEANSGTPPDFCSFKPIPIEDQGGVDEIMFTSSIQDIRLTSFRGHELKVFTLPIARPKGVELTLNMYTHPEACDGEFQPGDSIEGYAWIFGAPVASIIQLQ